MSWENPQSADADQHIDDHYDDQPNVQANTMMNSIPPWSTNGLSHEQLLAYYNATANFVYSNYMQPPMAPQHMADRHSNLDPPLTSLPSVHIQQGLRQQMQPIMASTHVPHSMHRTTTLHSNTDQHRPTMITAPLIGSAALRTTSSMTNPATTSTPAKRNRGDVSNNSDSITQQNTHYQQRTRVFNSNNTPIKRIRTNPQQQDGRFAQPPLNYLAQQKQTRSTTYNEVDSQQTSAAARRFATTRYPFSPFSIIFMEEVRDKTVVEDLMKHALEKHNFELKTVAYRRGRTENHECRILVFVENTESFAFLRKESNWPLTLAERMFTSKVPSIPPQLSLVLPSVSLQMEWEDFVKEIKERHPDIANVIRLKNKAQQPVRAVKLEFESVKARNDVLAEGAVSAMYMKHKVVEYYAQANVLICSNCYGIGHFRKNCPQSTEVTCKVCGEKVTDLKTHECSGVAKCIHCGGEHFSNDQKCQVVKDYRAALTRNMLAGVVPASSGYNIAPPPLSEFPLRGQAQGRRPYTIIPQSTAANLNDTVAKKLDDIAAKVEDESKRTREMLGDLKEEMRMRDEKSTQKVIALENKVEMLEKNFETYVKSTNRVLVNLCKAARDPRVTKEANWQAYWEEKIKLLSEPETDLNTILPK